MLFCKGLVAGDMDYSTFPRRLSAQHMKVTGIAHLDL